MDGGWSGGVFIGTWGDELIGTTETLIASLPSGGLSSVCLLSVRVN